MTVRPNPTLNWTGAQGPGLRSRGRAPMFLEGWPGRSVSMPRPPVNVKSLCRGSEMSPPGAELPSELQTPWGLAYFRAVALGQELPMPSSPQLKQRILAAVDKLPADATIEDAIERLVFIAKVDRGLAQAEAGQLIPQAEIAKRFGQ